MWGDRPKKIWPMAPFKNTKKAISRRQLKFAVIDIEAKNWIEFLALGFYDGNTYTDFVDLSAGLIWILSHWSGDIFAHFGGGYDFNFILKEALKLKMKVTDLIPRGSSLLCMTVTYKGNTVVFRDSAALLPFSLKKLTTDFKVKHPKIDFDVSRVQKVSPKLLKYLKFDCVGLYEVIEKFYNWPVVKKAGGAYTIASQAQRILRCYLKEEIPALHSDETTSDQFDSFIRKGFFGGRTEIFRPLHKSKTQPLYFYDVNSLYPHVMHDSPTWPGRVDFKTNNFIEGRLGFYEAEIFCPDLSVPVLGCIHNNKYIFPTGRFQGVYSSIELEYAKTLGYSFRIIRGLVMETLGPIFRPFISALYKIRTDSAKNSVDNIISKLILNSSYGRFGIRKDRENIVIDSGESGLIPFKEIQIGDDVFQFAKKGIHLSIFNNVAIASWVTSLARIHMHKLYWQCRDELFYTDTDSIATTAKLPINETDLGGLKLEATVYDACFLLPKTYVAGTGEMKKIAMKGFDKKKIKHFTVEDFENSLEGHLKIKIDMEPRFSKIKTALRNKDILSMTKSSTREIRAVYDKRIILKDVNGSYFSKPLNIGEKENGNTTKTGIKKVKRVHNDRDSRKRREGINFLD